MEDEVFLFFMDTGMCIIGQPTDLGVKKAMQVLVTNFDEKTREYEFQIIPIGLPLSAKPIDIECVNALFKEDVENPEMRAEYLRLMGLFYKKDVISEKNGLVLN